MGPGAVGVDIGGTKIAAGWVTPDGAWSRRTQIVTPGRDPDPITALIVDAVSELADSSETAVGVGAAGLVDRDGVVRYGPNLDWVDYPLRRELSERLGLAVTVDNDANAAAWAEYRVGAGRAAGASMLLLTIGTGVGGGLILDDHLVRGSQGLGAEFGHIVLAEGGPVCNCGNRGDLEALASGTAIGRLARERLTEAGEMGQPPGRRWVGQPPTEPLRSLPEINGIAVTEAAQAGDPFARDVLAECGFWLGVGIASLVNALDPELVVIGGGGVRAGDLLLEPAREAMAQRVMGREHRTLPPVVPAQLGADAGLVGAGLLALEEGQRAPTATSG